MTDLGSDVAAPACSVCLLNIFQIGFSSYRKRPRCEVSSAAVCWCRTGAATRWKVVSQSPVLLSFNWTAGPQQQTEIPPQEPQCTAAGSQWNLNWSDTYWLGHGEGKMSFSRGKGKPLNRQIDRSSSQKRWKALVAARTRRGVRCRGWAAAVFHVTFLSSVWQQDLSQQTQRGADG